MTAGLQLPTGPAPWAVLLARGTPTVPVPRRIRARRAAIATLHGLPEHSPVALVASGPLSHRQLRRAAARAGIVIDHEYVVIPALQSGRCVVEDHPDTLALLCSILPSRPSWLTRGAARLTVLTPASRNAPWWAVGAASWRVATGRRS